MENWKPIPGYEGYYSASSLGRVRSDRAYGRTWPGKVLRPATSRKGYLQVDLCCEGKERSIRVHVLVALTFLGPKPTGHTVNHKSGDKLDNRPENLEYCTPEENFRHAHRIGLMVKGYDKLRGEKCHTAKVTTEDVKEIRSLYATGQHTQVSLGLRFGLAQTQISRIVRREKWAHI